MSLRRLLARWRAQRAARERFEADRRRMWADLQSRREEAVTRLVREQATKQ